MNPAEEYIYRQPQELQQILIFIRSVLFETIPEVEEKIRYKIPFYFYNGKPLCYLNILKGKNFIDVGFWNGAKLSENQHLLVARNRKMIHSYECHSLESIDIVVLKKLLLEASALNL